MMSCDAGMAKLEVLVTLQCQKCFALWHFARQVRILVGQCFVSGVVVWI
jgi:hypothetical protein